MTTLPLEDSGHSGKDVQTIFPTMTAWSLTASVGEGPAHAGLGLEVVHRGLRDEGHVHPAREPLGVHLYTTGCKTQNDVNKLISCKSDNFWILLYL